jgi:hypothetical protein
MISRLTAEKMDSLSNHQLVTTQFPELFANLHTTYIPQICYYHKDKTLHFVLVLTITVNRWNKSKKELIFKIVEWAKIIII